MDILFLNKITILEPNMIPILLKLLNIKSIHDSNINGEINELKQMCLQFATKRN
jgi:hypothetical protein